MTASAAVLVRTATTSDRRQRTTLARFAPPGEMSGLKSEGRRVGSAHLAAPTNETRGALVQQQSTATSPDSRQPARPPAHRPSWEDNQTLVRDEEAAVPAACPIGGVPAGSHGRSRSDHRYPRRLRNRQVAGGQRHRVPKLIVGFDSPHSAPSPTPGDVSPVPALTARAARRGDNLAPQHAAQGCPFYTLCRLAGSRGRI